MRRIVEGVEWGPDNGHVADTPIDLAAQLLNGREHNWELAGKPKPAVLKKLAEAMNLAPADLIIVTGESDAAETEVENG